MVIVVYQFVALDRDDSAFAYGFYYMMNGCLIPLIVSLRLYISWLSADHSVITLRRECIRR